MEESQSSKSLRGRGIEFCCLSYPLVKSGTYLIPFEFAFVAGCIIVLTTTTPRIVVTVDILPHFFTILLLILAIVILAWQFIGLITVRVEMSSIYRLYIRLNFLLVLITTAFGPTGTALVATKHDQSEEVCTRIYGNPPLNSSSGVPIEAFESFALGRTICRYIMWAQAGAMGALVLILFITQTYFCYCQRAYGQKQREALSKLENYHHETEDGDTSTDALSPSVSQGSTLGEPAGYFINPHRR